MADTRETKIIKLRLKVKSFPRLTFFCAFAAVVVAVAANVSVYPTKSAKQNMHEYICEVRLI